MDGLNKTLTTLGSSMDSVVKTTIFMTNISVKHPLSLLKPVLQVEFRSFVICFIRAMDMSAVLSLLLHYGVALEILETAGCDWNLRPFQQLPCI